MRIKTVFFGLLALLVLVLPAAAEQSHHHLGVVMGYAKLVSNDVKPTGFDFSNNFHSAFSYRYSVNRNFDVVAEGRGTISHQNGSLGSDLHLMNSYFGPGLRAVLPQNNLNLFMQGTFYFVRESADRVSGNTTIRATENGVGMGLNGGLDIRVSRLISLPIEVNYLLAKPADDVSGFGVSTGLNFNFGWQ